MRRAVRVGLTALVIVFVAAQAVRIERSNPPVESDVAAPPEVEGLLRRACYDCHSHETVWPWYSQVAPVSWLVGHDVDEGREELNFSTWAAYGPRRKAKKLRETIEEVDEGHMPPWYYLLMHGEARLTPADRGALRAWTAAEIARLPARARLAPPGTGD
jgi:hypothetical protein